MVSLQSLLIFSHFLFNLFSSPNVFPTKPTTFFGEILVQDSFNFNIGIYQNTLVEYDPKFFFNLPNSIENRKFKVECNLSKPEIVGFFLNDKLGQHRIYVIPGSVNEIMINPDYSVSIKGPTEKENEILAQLGFNKDRLKSPKFTNMQDADLSLREMSMHADSIENLIDWDSLSEDFKKLMTAELIGFRYFWKSNLLYKYKNNPIGVDTLSELIQESLKSLSKITRLDETRSRYYNNSVSFYSNLIAQKHISAIEKENLSIYIMALVQTRDSLFQDFPKVRHLLITSTVTTAVFLAKDKSELAFSQYLLDYYSQRLTNQENAFATMQKDLNLKKTRFNLAQLNNYSLLNEEDEPSQITALATKPINIFSFWASWCKPCIEKFPDLLLLDEKENIRLITVNLMSSKGSWEKILEEKNMHGINHLFADKELSDRISSDCSIIQFPSYIITDEKLHVISIIGSHDKLLEYVETLQ